MRKLLEGLKIVDRDEKILYISEAIEKYSKSGIGIKKTGFGKRPAIVNVDIQKGFTSTENPLGGNMDEMVESVRTLLDAARPKGIPVMYTRVAYREDGSDCGVFGERVPTLPKWFQLNGQWDDIDERIRPHKEDYVFIKKMPSAFFGTDILHQLTYLNVDGVIVTGCTTSGCVRATVIDSMSHGFRTVIPEECVADRSPGPHKSNLFDMATKYADLLPLKDVLAFINSLPAREIAPQISAP